MSMLPKRLAWFRAVAALVLVAVVAGVFLTQHSSSSQQFSKLRNDPDAGMEADERRNIQTLAGNGGEALGGPASAEEEEYAQRAYPASEVPFAATRNAQAAFQSIRNRSRGKNALGQWMLSGPSQATVPEELSFYGGVSEKYVTGGRVTALAIDPNCAARKCRLWVGAAGGGVWRTDNALAGAPVWTFVSASLPSNAIGSLALDPTDATGNTIYAGTGEANASGDSEAGVGLFKSTDGGNTWTAVGTSQAIAYGRSIGSIAINPGNPDIIYMGTTRGVRGVSSVSGGATTIPPVAAPFGLYKTTDGGATWSLVWNG
ncbi:MAG: GH74, partial [uncultured Chloroflexia bacterium]